MSNQKYTTEELADVLERVAEVGYVPTEEDGRELLHAAAARLREQEARIIGVEKNIVEFANIRDAWEEACGQAQKNVDYYRGLLDWCGHVIGRDAFICDDGSVSDDVLRAKIPELVSELQKDASRFRALEDWGVDVLDIDTGEAVASIEKYADYLINK
jgi:hypothetical protein